MARRKKQIKVRTQYIHIKHEGIVNNGEIVVYRYNATLFADCMAVSVNKCIDALFSNGYKMRIT